MSAAFAEDPVREEDEKIICTVDTVEFCQLPSDAFDLLKQSGLNTPEGRSRNVWTEASHGDDISSTAKLEKVMTNTATKKGSHLRKSIQSSIGRLIHGTERRCAPGCMLFLVILITDDNSLHCCFYNFAGTLSIQHKGLQLKLQPTRAMILHPQLQLIFG